MPAKAKVGSWLANSAPAQNGEAFESSSESGSDSGSASGSAVNTANTKEVSRAASSVEGEEDDGQLHEEDEVVDWDVVTPMIRIALLDKSRKRREAFSARYLRITEDCKYQQPCSAH